MITIVNTPIKGYKDQYEIAMQHYQELLDAYQKEVSSDRYFEALQTVPFDLLKALQLCEKLELHNKLGNTARMYFSSLDDAKVFYETILKFNNNKRAELLENAAYMATIGELADEINKFVKESPYINDDFCIVPQEKVIDMAKRCLEIVPQYKKLMSSDFAYKFTESLIISFNNEDLLKAANLGLIRPNYLKKISLTETISDYREKVSLLYNHFNLGLPISEQYDLNLVGVTYNNEDGSSRQTYIKELSEFISTHKGEPVKLTAEQYIYKPSIGDPSPAIRVLWNGKCLGNLAADQAKDIAERFINPQLLVSLRSVYTGKNAGQAYNCAITLGIVAPEYNMSKSVFNKDEQTSPEITR